MLLSKFHLFLMALILPDPGERKIPIKVVYDHSNLYVAIVCQDSEPDLIRDIFDRF